MRLAAPIYGTRVFLREWTMADAPALFAYASAPEVTQYQSWVPHRSVADSTTLIASHLASADHDHRTMYAFAIVLRATDTVIGGCELYIQNWQRRHAEFGYTIIPDEWGKGYATEAAELLVRFAFDSLDLRQLIAHCDPRNTASVRVLQKLGLRFDCHTRVPIPRVFGWGDVDRYVIDRDDAAPREIPPD